MSKLSILAALVAAGASFNRIADGLQPMAFNHAGFGRCEPKYRTKKPKQRHAVKRFKKLHHRQRRGGK